jgi:hypothetical protein
MTRQNRSGQSSHRKLFVAAPLLAIAIAGVLLYAAYFDNSNKVVLNTHAFFEIGIVGRDRSVRYLLPDQSIGVPGGFMATTKYLSDGVNGNYPMYSSPYNCGNSTGQTICRIDILSKVDRQYTLGDFFGVWGVPLGPDQTLSPRFSTNSTYLWTMCTSTRANVWVPSEDWGSHVLRKGEIILLDYSPPDFTCA